MRINELLRPRGGTSTRSKLNSLLSLPFFLLDFLWSFYLSCPNTLISIYLAPILANGWGMAPMREGSVDLGGERE